MARDAKDDGDERWNDDEIWDGERARADTMVRVLSIVGRVFITAGVLVLLFVAYQLWGTGVHEARAQNRLSDEFEQALGDNDVDLDANPAPATDPAADPATSAPPAPPADGEAVARIRIPNIGVDKIVVEGVSVSDLKRGPGHYPDSPMPGQPGNAAIAGHRTTYGAPFNRIDELAIGDEILVTTLQGAFRYQVSEQKIVSPNQVEVLNNFGDNRLTLTACHPKYSARQRIVVVATLTGNAAAGGPAATGEPANPADDAAEAGDGLADEAEAEEEAVSLDGGLSGERTSAWPAILLGLACALIWLAAWVAGKLVERWMAYAVGAPLFFLVLFFFYESFYRLLPANF